MLSAGMIYLQLFLASCVLGMGAPAKLSPLLHICLCAAASAGGRLRDMATLPNPTFDAGLPANLDAEKTILGAILLDNAAYAEAAEELRTYMKFAPNAPDLDQVKSQLAQLDLIAKEPKQP